MVWCHSLLHWEVTVTFVPPPASLLPLAQVVRHWENLVRSTHALLSRLSLLSALQSTSTPPSVAADFEQRDAARAATTAAARIGKQSDEGASRTSMLMLAAAGNVHPLARGYAIASRVRSGVRAGIAALRGRLSSAQTLFGQLRSAKPLRGQLASASRDSGHASSQSLRNALARLRRWGGMLRESALQPSSQRRLDMSWLHGRGLAQAWARRQLGSFQRIWHVWPLLSWPPRTRWLHRLRWPRSLRARRGRTWFRSYWPQWRSWSRRQWLRWSRPYHVHKPWRGATRLLDRLQRFTSTVCPSSQVPCCMCHQTSSRIWNMIGAIAHPFIHPNSRRSVNWSGPMS
jgi:hypothetical protein